MTNPVSVEESKKNVTPATRPSVRRAILNTLAVPFLALFSALVLSAIFILISDPVILNVYKNFFTDPVHALALSWQVIANAYGSLFTGALGDPGTMANALRVYFATGETKDLLIAFWPLSESLVTSTPYIFGGLAVALGFRCGLFNIGAEGQIFIGAIVAAFVGYSVPGLPWIIHMPLTFLAGAAGGAVWGGIAGFLKARTGAHEVINTMMLNYIAFRLADYLVNGPMKRGGAAGNIPISRDILDSAIFPRFFSDPIRFHMGFFVALLIAVMVYVFLWKTTL
ncbi:MAG: ABC transporter permease [Chloroflexota bacterium]|nr:ABC transporter permease [Chloroflexota bacterium]